MKQETIERLRAEYELTKDGRLEPTGKVWHRWWPPFVREVGEAFPDILAVLEAARALKTSKTALEAARAADDWGDNDEDEPWDTFAAAHDALLALIDLGST